MGDCNTSKLKRRVYKKVQHLENKIRDEIEPLLRKGFEDEYERRRIEHAD